MSLIGKVVVIKRGSTVEHTNMTLDEDTALKFASLCCCKSVQFRNSLLLCTSNILQNAKQTRLKKKQNNNTVEVMYAHCSLLNSFP